MLRRPLLAAKTTENDLRQLRWPLLGSPKIDGIRALVVGGQLVSRTMKRIPNRHTQALFGRPELEGLDGELVVGEPYDKNLMQQTTSGVMSHGGQPAVRFFVFDKWDAGGVFYERLAHSRRQISYVQNYHNPIPVLALEHTLIQTYDDMLAFEEAYLLTGYEGIMLRSINGPYKEGRSTLRENTLLKVKRFYDGEATVIDFEGLRRNLNEAKVDERGYTKRSTSQDGRFTDELLGALHVRDCSTGICFSVGSGFTEAQRYDLWKDREQLLGKIIKYKSFAVGVKEKPRFPIFLGFRSTLDM